MFLRSQGFHKRHLRWKILNQNGVISKNSLIRSWPWKLGQGQNFDVVEIGCLRQVPYPKVIFEKPEVLEIQPWFWKKKKKKKKKKKISRRWFCTPWELKKSPQKKFLKKNQCRKKLINPYKPPLPIGGRLNYGSRKHH